MESKAGAEMKVAGADLDDESVVQPRPGLTPSGLKVPPVVRAGDVAGSADAQIGEPGQYPFTRGIFPDGYRGRLWTMRQYSGFGTAEESNERYKFLLAQGQTGLSVALDLPTQCGLDPTDPMARSEVGKVGVSLSNLAEMEVLFNGIDLANISTSFTINGSAAMIFAMYVACADKKGVPRGKLTGTIQNDILKEYVARGTWIFPVRPSMRMIADSILYSNQESPRFNPISIAGAHMRDAGCTAVEEMAYTLANGLAYVDSVVARGGDVAKFAKRLSFFFYVHMDLFEEVAKFRAGRRIWARMIKERYGVNDEKAQMFRFGVVCGGSSLTAAQPYNNVVRVAIETCAAVMGGAQSIFTCAYDEAFQIPTESSAELALRTQQIIGYESGIARTVDPLGGSYFVEQLTDQTEAGIRELIAEIDAYGGAVKAIEDGWLQSRVARRALERKQDTDNRDRLVVGQNCFRRENQSEQPGELFHLDPNTSKTVTDRYQAVLDTRNNAEAQKTLRQLSDAARREQENIMPYMVDCCHAYATIGEMVACLKEQWGEFQEPVHL
jgi:methylmalonyl-CoA mutase N-terminal domain/subunit